jgi:hypothetical protein
MEIKRKPQTRAQRNIRWIEKHCRIPTGPDKGRYVHLSNAQKELLFKIYDPPDGPQSLVVEDPELAAYVALLSICSPEATNNPDIIPQVNVDTFSVWNAAAGEELREVLQRKGEAIVCPALGTRYPRVA